jgi:hypothetical protein
MVFLVGPAVLGRGMRKLPLWVKAVIIVGFGWGFCLTVGLFKIEDTVA